MRKIRKNIVRRKRDVQEKRQSRKFSGDALLAQCLRDVHQVIIVHPDEIVGLRTPGDGIRVAVVNFFVSLPVRRLEVTEVLQVMKQRPDHLIGIAVVEFVALRLTQGHRHDIITGVAGGFGQRSLWNFARCSRPTNPRATALAQHRLNCGNKSADSRGDRPEIRACRIEGEWQSIGNDYQTVHLKQPNNVSCLYGAFHN